MWRKSAPPAEAYSLGRRLFVRLLGALLVLAGGLFLFVNAYAQRAADSAFDRLLLASALSIADSVRIQEGRFSVDLPYSSLAMLAQARRDRIFYRITAPDGAAITGYPDLPSAGGDTGSVPRFENASYRGMPLRVATLDRFVAQPGLAGWVSITVAQTGEERTALAHDVLANAFLPIAFAVLAAAGLIWLGIRQALAPLGALERMIRERQVQDLSPIAMPPPQEVSQLVHAINQLMLRLKGNLDTMQTFLADAAHQIRTPLASLRLQAQLAMDEDDPEALRRIAGRVHRNAVEVSQLTSQLLNHAMVVHRRESLRPEPLDLGALLEQVVQRARAVAEDTPIRLEIDPALEPAMVPGDPISLREALTNLVDNAIKYAGEHAGGGGPIDVSLGASAAGSLRVEVADRGPGIPDDEKPAVLERFGRGRSAASVAGSGLGLAIVKAVAEAHGATLSLHDRPGGGLIARMDFPVAAAARPAAAPAHPALPPLMGVALLLAALLGPWPAGAEPLLSYPAPGAPTERLLIHSATDRLVIEPLILDFQRTHPDVAVDYLNLGTAELYAGAVERGDRAAGPGAATGGPDLLISSAADLQVKLVNDGYTRPHISELTLALPEWANWRDEAFGFTFEPSVIAYNRDLLPEQDVPRTREDLIRLLEGNPDRFRGRIGSYDIADSGIGYLFAAHDSILFGQFWQLVEAMGRADVRLACCTGEILDGIERGELLIGYNMLGSYAQARANAGAPIGILLPQDYTQVISRVAVIPRTAPNPGLAGQFIDYLLSRRGQEVIAGRSALFAISAEVMSESSAIQLRATAPGPLQPVTLSPALLVFLDQLKRQRFLQRWQAALQP
ncbi:extracellular solute-binding protein [Azospirillum sp. SYSU D00513]|uniref:sensor histidine kinase n=1 Tax=Azospirillum sp. SYSU D00513 TaxID=2812561 RepID=UPI001A95E1B3|nr:extracellular solute-binding protein [Azospirillum sp. SYSU D00513]